MKKIYSLKKCAMLCVIALMGTTFTFAQLINEDFDALVAGQVPNGWVGSGAASPDGAVKCGDVGNAYQMKTGYKIYTPKLSTPGTLTFGYKSNWGAGDIYVSVTTDDPTGTPTWEDKLTVSANNSGCQDATLDLSGYTDVYVQFTTQATGGIRSIDNVLITDRNGATSVDNPELSASLKLFPLPVKDDLTIEYGEEIDWVEVYDLSGKVCISKRIGASKANIDISSVTQGVYIVKAIGFSGQTEIKKIVKL